MEDDVDVWRFAISELHARNDDDDAFDAPIRGVPVGTTAILFGTEKLGRCDYPKGKKV